MVPLFHDRPVRQAFHDNAASRKAFREVSGFLRRIDPYDSNIHRGSGHDAVTATQLYEQARSTLSHFVGGDAKRHMVIPVRNMTEGSNLLANTLPFPPEGQGFDFSSLPSLEDPLG